MRASRNRRHCSWSECACSGCNDLSATVRPSKPSREEARTPCPPPAIGRGSLYFEKSLVKWSGRMASVTDERIVVCEDGFSLGMASLAPGRTSAILSPWRNKARSSAKGSVPYVGPTLALTRARIRACPDLAPLMPATPEVHPAGLEPATSGSVNQHSIQLSYGCVCS